MTGTLSNTRPLLAAGIGGRAVRNGGERVPGKSPAVGRLRRVAETGREPLRLIVDGAPVEALAGDSVLTALLLHRPWLRRTEFTGAPRAGFCLMGACQDCWVWTEDGARVRACTTPASPGMRLLTRSPLEPLA